MSDIVEQYLATWNAEGAERAALLAQHWSDDDRQLRFQWGLGPAGEEPVVIGFDVVVLDDDRRIQDVRGFLDQVPS